MQPPAGGLRSRRRDAFEAAGGVLERVVADGALVLLRPWSAASVVTVDGKAGRWLSEGRRMS